MRSKLNLGMIVIVLMLWAVCIYTILGSAEVDDIMTELEEDIVPGAIAMSRIKYEAVEVRMWTLTYILRGDVLRDGKYIHEWLIDSWTNLERLAADNLELETQTGIEESEVAQNLLITSRELIAVSGEIVYLKDQGIANDVLFEKVRTDFGPVFYPLRNRLSEHYETHLMELVAAESRTHHLHSDTTNIVLLIGSVATLLAAVIIILLNRFYIAYMKERKNSENSLRDSEEKFRSISDLAQDAIIVMDNDGLVTFFNRAAGKLFGYSSDEIMGMELHSIITPEQYREAHRKAFPEFRKTGSGMAIGRTLELEGLAKDGRIFPVELSVSAMKIKGKWQAAGIIRDITERKQTELELIEASEAAENASRTKSEFLSNMSHEIRTPMNAIIGMADLLWETDLTLEQKQYIGIFRSAGENLLSLINDILDISKIEAGRIELESTDFLLSDIIERTCETLAMRAHEKGLELSFRILPDVPLNLRGDPGRLRQILVNLIGNAIKFTSEGEVNLQVEKDTDSENEGRIRFTVRDTGIGIPPAKLERIFDSFTQADSTHTRRFGGTGLGLSISKQLAELMEGGLSVESEAGKGSSFILTVCFDVLDYPVEDKVIPDVRIEDLKVLIVDDNATNRLILEETLTGWGAIVTKVESGAEAIQELKQTIESGDLYDLVLLDCIMPEMNGFEVADRISCFPKAFSTTIMMLTSNMQKNDRDRCKKLGIRECLVKPVKKSDLADAVRRVLGTKEEVSEEKPEMEALMETSGRQLSILFADDSEDNRFLVKAFLRKMSYSIDFVENGKEAVEKYMQGNYDIVLMDVQMPVMDGLTATGLIRKWEIEKGRSPVPILALTAYALKEEIDRCINAGCTAHISKPVKKTLLIETIESLIR